MPPGEKRMVLGALFIAAIQAGAAAPGSSPETRPPEIVVTGERVPRSIKDTASSVHVVSARELQAMPADRIDRVLAGIPNVQLGNGSEGPMIRGQDSTGVLQGLPAFLGGARPRATLEVDGRAVGFQEFLFGSAPLWDVHQIEVFRSPLTVTHGRNSIGGGIVITTNDPTYDWEGAGRVIAGNFSTREASAMVSGPILADQFAFRLAADVRHARTTSKLAKTMRGADPNDDDYSLIRFKLLGEPRALPGLKLLATFTHTYSRRPQVVPLLRPFGRRNYPFGGYGIFGGAVSAATLHATQQFSRGRLEAIVTSSNSHTRRFADPGVGEAHAHLADLSAELFGSWKLADGVTLRGGLHGLNSRFRQHIDLSQFISSVGDFRDHQQSFGAFAEAELAVTDRLTVSAGGRRQQDRQVRTGGLTGAIVLPIEINARFSAWLPKLSASYALTKQIKAGVLLQRAYNPGGATLAFDSGKIDTFKAEHLWDYEAFVKGDLPGGRASFAVNLFYNRIGNAQRDLIVPFTLPNGETTFLDRFDNVPKARTGGAEIEFNWRPLRAFTLSGGLGLLRSRIVTRHNSEGGLIGREFERTPHVTASAAVDWIPTDRLRLSAQWRYHSRYFSNDLDTPEQSIPPATIVDARAAYSVNKVTIFAYARNVFDRLRLTYLFDPDTAEAEDPRVVGVGLEARF